MNIDVEKIREDFPILSVKIQNKPLIYFDNAATTQKPIQVIESIKNYYTNINSNIHRGVHYLSQLATEAYENSRKKICQFINADKESEIIFTKGTTEAINLIAFTFGKKYLKENDEVIISSMEHHSNIVPWQLICEEKKATLKIIPLNDDGSLNIDTFKKMLNERVKIISIVHISNVLGTINPIKEITKIAHSYNIPVVIDGAQATAHMKIDVKDIDCDFYCFSGHKMYGPTGIGILYGKLKWLEDLPPYQGGGDMINEVSFEKTTYNEPPLKFEAGTQNIADAIALQSAVEYIEKVGLENIFSYEEKLRSYAELKLKETEFCQLYGTTKDKSAVISFNINNLHHYDVGTILDKYGIAVRTGHHCAQPLMKLLNVSGTIRASFAFYNTFEEIDLFIQALHKTKKLLS